MKGQSQGACVKLVRMKLVKFVVTKGHFACFSPPTNATSLCVRLNGVEDDFQGQSNHNFACALKYICGVLFHIWSIICGVPIIYRN